MLCYVSFSNLLLLTNEVFFCLAMQMFSNTKEAMDLKGMQL